MQSWQEREAIRKAYSGPKWDAKVKCMSERQVHAIFIRLQNQRKI